MTTRPKPIRLQEGVTLKHNTRPPKGPSITAA